MLAAGVFLLCWVPFFTINIVNAICIRYDLFDVSAVCQIDPPHANSAPYPAWVTRAT